MNSMNNLMNGGAEDDGIHPLFSGAPMWFTMHTVAAGFPCGDSQEEQERKTQYRAFFVSLLQVLPCKSCRDNVKPLIRSIMEFDFEGACRRQVEDLIFDLHNQVNKKLGKKVLQEQELEACRRMYESGRVGITRDGQDRTGKCGYAHVVIRNAEKAAKASRSIMIDRSCLLE